MSTSKVDTSGAFRGPALSGPTTALVLAPSQVAIGRNGVEFLSRTPIPLWTEVTVELKCPEDGRSVRGTGVVVECTGSRQAGYAVSLLFTNLTRQSQARLARLIEARLS